MDYEKDLGNLYEPFTGLVKLYKGDLLKDIANPSDGTREIYD